MKRIKASQLAQEIPGLMSGDEVLLSGIIYTARDQAHKRLVDSMKKSAKSPIDLKGAVIYYCGPTKTPKGKIIGSCGPTTSSRMDSFASKLLKAGVLAMIGKGNRSKEVQESIKEQRGVYFLAYAGCGALLSKYVMSAKVVAYKELGPEAIHRLEVKDLPLIVAIDSRGKNIYQEIKL
ncbi:MAG: FumA C-terminus/TtdB family hydratase beta subunit [Candidatus Omnitrophica bacterium]|nr:FumA C-terminus/TtdB family hydratase beta subunit [Candidatus Omnitrophota bacterium]